LLKEKPMHLFIRQLLIILIFFQLFSCKSKTDNPAKNRIEGLSDQDLKVLSSPVEYQSDTKKYKDLFWQTYDSAIAENNSQKQGYLLQTYGDVLIDAYAFDSVYVDTLLNFLQKNTPSNDTAWLNLYLPLCDQLYAARKYDINEKMAKKGIEYCEKYKNDKLKASLLNIIGLGYSNRAQPDKAIQFFIEGIAVGEKNNYYRKLGSMYNNVAYCYDMLYASKESDKMYQKAAHNFLMAKDTSNYFALLTTYAVNSLTFSKDTLRSISLIDSAFIAYNQYSAKTPFDSNNANQILAYKYYYLKDYDMAQKYLSKSTDYMLKTGVEDFLLTYNYIMGSSIYFKKHGRLQNIENTKKWAEEMTESEQYYDALELYQQLYEQMLSEKKYPLALDYYLKITQLNDELRKNNQQGQIFELEKKYASEQKEIQLKQQKTLIQKKNNQIALLLVSLLVLVLLWALISFWKRQKLLLKEKQNSMKFTKQLFENTEQERMRIASDLHDSISHELLTLKNQMNENQSTLLQKIDFIINDIRNISRNLHPVMFDKVGLLANIEQLIERVQVQSDFLISTDFDYHGELKASSELQVYRIIQEAVSNIIKYSKAFAAKISIIENHGWVLIEIIDNGKGFDVNQKLDSGKAFGLHSIIERSRAIGGIAKIESSEKGTVINIKLPVEI
jgi:signal transduction histidine kinase